MAEQLFIKHKLLAKDFYDFIDSLRMQGVNRVELDNSGNIPKVVILCRKYTREHEALERLINMLENAYILPEFEIIG